MGVENPPAKQLGIEAIAPGGGEVSEHASAATTRNDDDGPFIVQCVNCGVSYEVRSRFSTRWWCGPRCKRADIGDGEV